MAVHPAFAVIDVERSWCLTRNGIPLLALTISSSSSPWKPFTCMGVNGGGGGGGGLGLVKRPICSSINRSAMFACKKRRFEAVEFTEWPF